MPFDGTTLKQKSWRLSDVLRELAIAPVAIEKLNQHKQAEIARHPASWPVRYVMLFMALVAAALSLSFVTAMVMISSDAPSAIIAFAVSAGFVAYLLTVKHVQEAHWVHTGYFHPDELPSDVPQPIVQLARLLSAHLSASEFRLGTLIQEEVLDPYLLIRGDYSTGWVCLGIWDGERILHIAEQQAI